MSASVIARDLLDDLTRRGFALRAVAGSLSIVPASKLTADDRQAVRQHRADLLALVPPVELWNLAEAIRLMDAADATVERLNVSGLDPIIQAAAAGCVDAHRCRSMAVVRSACLEIEQRAHALSATRHK